ncbi:MAG: hypothetical protein WKF73_10160 [Nocardioidaceae bacterium]
MWADAKGAHEAGRLRAVEVRGSGYVGGGVGAGGHISRQIPAALEGKRAWVIGRSDQPDIHRRAGHRADTDRCRRG